MSQNKKIILVDIDIVLLDSQKLRDSRKEKICQCLKINSQTFDKFYIKYYQTLEKSSDFSPLKFASLLSTGLNNPFLKGKVLESFFNDQESYIRSLYPDTLLALRKLHKNYRLGIFSEGIKDFQMAKLTLSGVINYLEENLIFIYPDKTGKAAELMEKLGKIYFVDDTPKHIKDIASTAGAYPIWLKRGTKAETEEKLSYPTILSLEELNF
jgi:FMN phosphatase YigB (HAD superfamily)